MNILFIIAVTAFLLAPGIVLSYALKIKEHLILSSIALSYSSFFLIFTCTSYFQILESAIVPIVLVITATSLLFVTFLFSTKRISIGGIKEAIHVVGIVLVVLIYNLTLGAASDLPSDLYAHLERFQLVLSDLNDESVNQSLQFISWSSQGYAWYYFLAIAASLTEATSAQLIESASLVTNALFFTCLYCFSCSVFRQNKHKRLVAVLVCIFVALHMGTNIFAFVRYYTLGPTVIGFCLYFAAVSLFLDSLDSKTIRSLYKAAPILAIYTLVCIGNHTQEAMFIVVICMITTFIYSYRLMFQVALSDDNQNAATNVPKTYSGYNLCMIASALLAILLFFGLFSYSHFTSNDPPLDTLRLWRFSEAWWIFPSITTLNLRYQFIQTLSLWGCLVYALFLINYRRYRNNLFILAGMFSPLFTILNPFFVDLFLHHKSSTTLWRLSYFIPIHFVAADIFVHYVKQVKLSSGVKRLLPLCAISLLVVLLLPIKNTWQGIHFSRTPTLAKTEFQNSYKYYGDLIGFLDTQAKNTVVTDPITGYLIASMTHHNSPRRKFFRSDYYNHFSFERYEKGTFEKYKGYLLLINKRTQPLSEIGRLSGHWPETQLKEIHYYYPQSLIEHIAKYPSKFSQVWSENGISVYLIK